MTITFPLSLPAKPNFVTFDMGLTHAVGGSRSPFTHQENVQEFLGSTWTLSMRLPTMTLAQANEWFGTLVGLRGQRGTFLLGSPDHLAPLGTGNGTPLVNGASQTGITLVTDGWANSETVLKTGDFFQLGSAATTHLYVVTADVVSDGAGNATIDFGPRLRVSPANNDPLVIVNPKGQWRLPTNKISRASTLQKFSVQLAAVEAH